MTSQGGQQGQRLLSGLFESLHNWKALRKAHGYGYGERLFHSTAQPSGNVFKFRQLEKVVPGGESVTHHRDKTPLKHGLHVVLVLCNDSNCGRFYFVATFILLADRMRLRSESIRATYHYLHCTVGHLSIRML